jgi:hypothetical protein
LPDWHWEVGIAKVIRAKANERIQRRTKAAGKRVTYESVNPAANSASSTREKRKQSDASQFAESAAWRWQRIMQTLHLAGQLFFFIISRTGTKYSEAKYQKL